MLEQVDLTQRTEKDQYKKEAAGLKERLSSLQQEIKGAKLPVIILFEGWGAAGKGSLISKVIINLDPRGFQVYSIVPADSAESRKPLLWRYWTKIPQQGQISVFDRSWYQDISVAKLEENLSDEDIAARTASITTFERQLTDDGYLILKFFLHISQEEQKSLFNKLLSSKNTAWRVTDLDRKRNRQYDRYYRLFDQMLESTNTPNAPWHVVPCEDKYTAQLFIFRTLVASIEEALRQKQAPAAPAAGGIVVPDSFAMKPMPKLQDVRLDKALTDEEYHEKLKKAQKKLKKLHNELYQARMPVIVAYEGWDAAGKGGNIRRVAAALDPRGYEVIPIAAPDKAELAHHYLWRFWNHMPKTGHVAIFDRTWYGRVMVERIEGFCSTSAWQRAYQEINEFEWELHQWGAVILKFWLHIDPDEQLRRFKDRQETPSKQWKITEEDWRNREKWGQYETAVNDMLQYTSTGFAPWHIIESQDKKYGRIKALHTMIAAIEEGLANR